MRSPAKLRTALLLCLALAAALLAAGCGGGSSTTTVIEKTVTETNGEEVTVPNGDETEAGEEGGGGAETVHLSSFQTPSGNIGCVLLGGTARCDISKRTWKPPARPNGCPEQVDFGQGLQVGRTDESGSFVCAGDTAMNPEAAKLAYGTDDRFGGFLCDSSTSGVTCMNAGGHGFFISIQAYRTF